MKGSDQKRSPTGEEPRSNLQKTAREEEVESESNDEDANPNQREYRTVPNEDITTKDRFQSSPTIVTSKETEAGGGLNLAVKRTKSNNEGPSSHNRKGGLSKPTAQEARKTKAPKAVNTEPKDDKATPNSSTAKKNQEGTKRITRQTNEKEILDMFQNKDVTPGEWDELTEQVLTRGLQKEAEQILTAKADAIVEVPPPGFSDDSDQEEEQTVVRRSGRQSKNQGPKRYGIPVSLSLKLIGCEVDITDLKMAALEAYRIRLANFEKETGKLTESKFGLLERQLFWRRFGHSSLDISKSWNSSWRMPLQFETEKKQREGK